MPLRKEYLARNNRIVKEFKPGMNLKARLVDTTSGKVISSEKEFRARQKEFKQTGVRQKDNKGKFIKSGFGKGEHQKFIGSGIAYFKGVPVLQLKRRSTISKIKLNQLNAQLKGEKTPEGKTEFQAPTQAEDIATMLERLYGYKKPSEGDMEGAPFWEIELKKGNKTNIVPISEFEGGDDENLAIELALRESPGWTYSKTMKRPEEFSGGLPAMLKANRVLSKRKIRGDYVIDFWTVDTEDDSKGSVKIIDFFDGKTHKTFQGDNVFKLREAAFDFILSLKRGSKIFAVNIGYDLNNIVFDSYKEWNVYFSGSFLVKATLYRKEKNRNPVHFFEAMSQLPLSVEKMGDLLKLQKMQVKNKVDVEYCKRDTEIVWQTLERVFDFDRLNGIDFGATCGAKALKYWRGMQTHDWKQRVFAEFIPAYRGGRSEIFLYGQQKNVNIYDVNSLYPFVMQKYDYPDPELALATRELQDLGIYFATVKVKDCYIPYLGKRLKNKFIFPVGTFTGLWTGFELLRAESQLESIKIIEGFKFDNAGKVFKPYVDRFYKKRLDNFDDNLLNKYIKILMASLYGKFGQRENSLQYDSKNKVFQNSFVGFPDHANIIWSIFTTAYARDHLWNLLLEFQEYVAYTDTDSLHLVNGYTMETGPELGQVKHEGNFVSGLYLQPKLYALTDYNKNRKIKAKGIPKKYRETYIDQGQVEFERPVKLVEFLRNQWYIKENPELERVLVLNYWHKVKKTLSEKYTKRQILDKDGHTWPISL